MDEQKEMTEAQEFELAKVRRNKLKELVDGGKDPFEIVRYDRTNVTTDILNNTSEFEGKQVKIAGRLMAKRIMGKASFGHIMDGFGKIQGYFSRDVQGEENYAEFKKYDIGDIIGIEGEVFVTHTGETSIKVSKSEFISKTLYALPAKDQGLKDIVLPNILQ